MAADALHAPCTVTFLRMAVQELHMNVLEISPGMDRSGNNLVKLVGEATQSHTVVCKGPLHACSSSAGVSRSAIGFDRSDDPMQ